MHQPFTVLHDHYVSAHKNQVAAAPLVRIDRYCDAKFGLLIGIAKERYSARSKADLYQSGAVHALVSPPAPHVRQAQELLGNCGPIGARLGQRAQVRAEDPATAGDPCLLYTSDAADE